MTDHFFANQSIIITLDVDPFLFDRLQQIVDTDFCVAEINTTDATLLTTARKQFPSLRIGAGQITNSDQLKQCLDAGVHFVTSPGFLPAMAQAALIYGMNYLPGIATLSEAMQLMALGHFQARPYPASLAFCALLNKSLPTLRLYPSDIDWDDVEHYLSLPAVAAVSLLNPTKKQLTTLSVATQG